MESNIQVKPEEKREGLHTFLYALLSVVAGYLFVKWTFGPALGCGIFVFTCLFLVLAVTFRAVHTPGYKGKPFSDAAGFLLIFLLGGVMLVSDNSGIKFITYYIEIHAVLYWLYHFYGNRRAEGIDGGFFFDGLKAVWVMPFGSFGSLFTALFSAGREGKGRRVLGYVLLGLLVAVLPTVAVLLLLMSGDLLFESFFDTLFSNLTEGLFESLLRLVLSIPVSLYLFGALWSNATHRYGSILDTDARERAEKSVRVLHPVVSCTAVVPLIVLYVIYLVLHIGYYFSAFRSIVPEGYTTAAYARSGFFELCAVAFINLLVLWAGVVFTKRREDGNKTLAWRVTALILSAMTLALSASAISKMLLYIRLYGLTQKRVITIWAMLFLMLTFIYIVIRQFAASFPIWSWSILTGLVMLLLLGYANVDGLIARYNIDAWKEGRLASIDVEAIGELSDAVTPYLIELAGVDETAVSEQARRLLFLRSVEEKNRWCYENIPSLVSDKAVKAYEKALEEAGEQENARVEIRLINRSSEDIALLNYDFRLEGYSVFSGGACNADDSAYGYEEIIWLDEVFEKALLQQMEAELSLVLPGEEEEYYIGTIDLSDAASEPVTYCILGNRGEGFWLEKDRYDIEG